MSVLQPYLPVIVPLAVLVVMVAVQLVRRHIRQVKLRPAWASFFSPLEWERFILAVERELTGRQLPCQYHEEGFFTVQVDETEMGMGLSNLAQICRQAGRDQWAEIIRNHFEQILNVQNDHADDLLHDFERVKDQLFIRLMALDGAPRQNLAVARNDIPGTIAYLAIDLLNTVRSISTGDVENWQKTPGQLYDIGLQNVRTKSVVQEQRVSVDEGIEFIGVMGEDFFAASHALLLHEHPEWLGAYGALLIIPTRHTFVLYPINDLQFTKAMQYLAVMATGMEKEGPGSISNRIYWYSDGCYVDIPYTIENKKVTVTPPAEFVALMNRIAEQQGEMIGEG